MSFCLQLELKICGRRLPFQCDGGDRRDDHHVHDGRLSGDDRRDRDHPQQFQILSLQS